MWLKAMHAVEGKTLTGDEVRQVFEAMLSQEEIDRLGQEFGVVH
jgi:hypothetical protein